MHLTTLLRLHHYDFTALQACMADLENSAKISNIFLVQQHATSEGTENTI